MSALLVVSFFVVYACFHRLCTDSSFFAVLDCLIEILRSFRSMCLFSYPVLFTRLYLIVLILDVKPAKPPQTGAPSIISKQVVCSMLDIAHHHYYAKIYEESIIDAPCQIYSASQQRPFIYKNF